ncbi:MAG TPA: hypothetical protein VNK73_08720 [Actinomycetota bacterium]|nr:hypothetical protein [Actinomycetota bacterium]
MSELTRLLLKAVRGLPREEQDQVIEELLDARFAAGGTVDLPPAGGPGLPARLPQQLFLGEPRLELLKGTPGAGESLTMVPARLSSEQHERLKQWCQANGFTMAVVLRGLVARFLDEQERRAGGPAASSAE